MKKQLQLGMNPSTASNRLVKDLLFKFVGHLPCHRCGGVLTRETFSVDHIEPWLDNDDPTRAFFDLDNIAFSHNRCNGVAARKPWKVYATEADQKRAADNRRVPRNRGSQRKAYPDAPSNRK